MTLTWPGLLFYSAAFQLCKRRVSSYALPGGSNIKLLTTFISQLDCGHFNKGFFWNSFQQDIRKLLGTREVWIPSCARDVYQLWSVLVCFPVYTIFPPYCQQRSQGLWLWSDKPPSPKKDKMYKAKKRGNCIRYKHYGSKSESQNIPPIKFSENLTTLADRNYNESSDWVRLIPSLDWRCKKRL